MSDNMKNDDKNTEKIETQTPAADNQVNNAPAPGLDDEQRIKVLSPGMLVAKRFIRNKLAIVGLCCIIGMALFSIIGPFISPYGQGQQFTKVDMMEQMYASVTNNTEFRYIEYPNASFDSADRGKFISAIRASESIFEVDKKDASGSEIKMPYRVETIGTDFYQVYKGITVAKINTVGNVTEYPGMTFSAEIQKAYDTAVSERSKVFFVGDDEYAITSVKKDTFVFVFKPVSLVTKLLVDTYSESSVITYDFYLQAETALNSGAATFNADGVNYAIETDGGTATIYSNEGGVKTPYANLSTYLVQNFSPSDYISVQFKEAVKEAIVAKQDSFVFAEAGQDITYSIERENEIWKIKKKYPTTVLDIYSYPTKAHWLGTDSNGMDNMTRLMFGGRVSLIIGFIVVAIELVIGVVLGGISGYFGRLVDQLIMRIVDVFNCIPFMPILIIIGAVMDQLRVESQVRLFYLMIILGVLGWPGVARMVRGQILTLREQEFMIAAEATGLSVYRRIFKHLIPNVIPLLIVYATMNLGSTILTEATLSFLGFGVKYPFASWGRAINEVSNSYVMVKYLHIWIPPGICILITVLGFNFIGDGLRDAFDPKMKR